MAGNKFYGTGRRKKSIARVYLTPGTGRITINKRDIEEYFGHETLKMLAKELDNSEAIINSIEEMKDNVGKKGFADKYNTFIQNVANHMTIFAPFIPALTQLLIK